MPDRLLRSGLRHNLGGMKRIAISRPPLPALPVEGGCHCGAMRYAVTARPMVVNARHCDDCKRLSGGPFGLYLNVAKDALETLSEPRGRFIRTGGSGNAIPIERCAQCGTRMWHLPEVAPDLGCPTGLCRPSSHREFAFAAPIDAHPSLRSRQGQPSDPGGDWPPAGPLR
jgi:hypothetical protein